MNYADLLYEFVERTKERDAAIERAEKAEALADLLAAVLKMGTLTVNEFDNYPSSDVRDALAAWEASRKERP